jgi:DNA-binding Lrp family transcriptional regulator
MEAYVLVQIEPEGDPIAATLRTIPGVASAEDLSGPYDAIALAHYDSMEQPIERITAEISGLPGVIRALTAPVIGSFADASNDEAA